MLAGAVAAAHRAATSQGLPTEIQDDSPRFFTAHNRDSLITIPAGFGDLLGLPPVPDGHVPDSLESTLLMNYDVGSVDDVSAVPVRIELLVLDPSAQGGFQGADYEVVVDCTRFGEVAEYLGRGSLN